MIYGCIECHRIWCNFEMFDSLDIPHLDLDTCTDISHGICPECFQSHEDRIHRHQKSDGCSECFNRNDDYHNNECLFKPVYGRAVVRTWKSNVVILKAA